MLSNPRTVLDLNFTGHPLPDFWSSTSAGLLRKDLIKDTIPIEIVINCRPTPVAINIELTQANGMRVTLQDRNGRVVAAKTLGGQELLNIAENYRDICEGGTRRGVRTIMPLGSSQRWIQRYKKSGGEIFQRSFGPNVVLSDSVAGILFCISARALKF